MSKQAVKLPHHQKAGPCLTRPAYRDGRRKTAVKVYTVTDESCYILFFGVPSIGLDQALKDKCRQFGQVIDITKLSEYPDREMFTDVFLVKFSSLGAARCANRSAKRTLDDTSFYGGSLHLCYAPEYESVADCRMKLYNRRRDNARISRKAEFDYAQRLRGDQSEDTHPNSTHTIPVHHSKEFDNVKEPIAGPSHIPLERVIPPAPPPLETAFTPSALPICANTETVGTYGGGGGDALEDARLYWSSRGLDFPSNPPTNPVSNLGSSRHPAPQGLPLCTKKPPRRPIPLPVLQALTCRPYSEQQQQQPQRQPQPATTKSNSRPSVPNSTATAPRLLPRVLFKKPSNSVGPPKTSELFKATNSDTTPIQVGELKRLAMTLGPLQGPQLPDHSGHDRANSSKRVVFHRDLKRRKLNSEDEAPL